MPLWARRVLTRLLAIVPVIICVIIYGGSETAVEDLLLYTQVFLSIAFASVDYSFNDVYK